MTEPFNIQDQLKTARKTPESELDLTLRTTDPVWGKDEIPIEVIQRLSKYNLIKDYMSGEDKLTISSLWGLLGFYTRDLRLGNLSDKQFHNEIAYCQYYLDLAGDLLQAGMIEPFVISLSRAATILELSQSKNGFLRKRMGTITSEEFKTTTEPPKKGLFGSFGNKKVE